MCLVFGHSVFRNFQIACARKKGTSDGRPQDSERVSDVGHPPGDCSVVGEEFFLAVKQRNYQVSFWNVGRAESRHTADIFLGLLGQLKFG